MSPPRFHDSGADPTFASDAYTVGTLVARALSQRDLTTAAVLLSAGASVNNGEHVPPRSPIPLHRAARHGWSAGVAMLLLAGSEIDAVNHDGETAMDVAHSRESSYTAVRSVFEAWQAAPDLGGTRLDWGLAVLCL